MYLPKDSWSPRYDATFYTVQVEGYAKVLDANGTTLPQFTRNHATSTATLTDTLNSDVVVDMEHMPDEMGGRTNLPAVYYKVVVSRQHGKTVLYRRYSQFVWLYQQLRQVPLTAGGPNDPLDPISMPPANNLQCLPLLSWLSQWLPSQSGISSEGTFAQRRMEQLDNFLESVLSRGPQYSSHSAVRTFLEI